MLNPTWYPSNRQLRQFAVISLFGFGLAGAIARFRFELETLPWILWVVAAVVFALGLVSARLVLPVYAVLMAVTFPIGWLISNILLRVMYYGIITPVGLLSRLLGRDPLRLKRPQGHSYWQPHRQRADPESYYRQA